MPWNSSSRLNATSGFQSVIVGAQLGEVVAEAERAHRVAGLLEARHHVVLGPELVDLLVAVALEARRRHEALVHQHQDAQRLHTARLSRQCS